MIHRKIEDDNLLARYIHGKLLADEKDDLEHHLFTCNHCQHDLHQSLADEHFVHRFVTGTLPEAEAQFLEEHYFACSECFALVQRERQLAVTLKAAARRGDLRLEPAKDGHPNRFWQWLISLKFLPQVAVASAVVALVLIYPAWRGVITLSHYQQELSELRQPQANSQIYSLDGLRSTSGIPRIPLNPATETFILTFNLFESPGASSQYRAEIINAQQQIVWHTNDLQPTGEFRLFAITCHGSFFLPGRYELKIYHLDPATATSRQESSFSFEITTLE